MPLERRARQKLEEELSGLLKKGRLQRAALVIRSILEAEPDDDRLFVKLAEVSLKLGDEDGVRLAYRGAAAAAERKGFYLRAMAALRQLARWLPPHERPWEELARLAFRLGLLGDALGFLDEGVRSWEAAGDRAAALAALRRCHELAPDDVQRSLRLTREVARAGRLEEAIGLLFGEAERHRAAGRAAAWLELSDERAALQPADRALALEVAGAFLERAEPKRALRRLQALVRASGHDEAALRLLMRAFEAGGQPDRRRAAARELARTLRAAGRGAEAEPLWRELLEFDATDREARVALGLPPPQAPRVASPPPPEPRPLTVGIEPDWELVDLATEAFVLEEEEIVDLEASAVVEDDPAADAGPGGPETTGDLPLIEPSAISILEPEEPPDPSSHGLDDDLAHAEFLVAHRFEEEARELLAALSAAHPGHPGVAALAARLATGPARISPHPSPALAPVEAGPAAAPVEPAPEAPPGDVTTRFDLGVAYREMGMLSEASAVLEAALAVSSGARAVDCLLELARCEAGVGDLERAALTLQQVLVHEALTPAAAERAHQELGRLRARREAGGPPA